jgi:O-antigen/teichoic acid export membrane protein
MTMWALPRLKPYDTDTEKGRDSERRRRAALTTLLSAFARGSQLAVIFVSMRVALPYLGQARFGVWMTISSLTSLMLLFDFGIGNGMVSRVASLAARGDPAALRNLLRTGLSVLIAIGICIGALCACLAAYAPLQWLYKDAAPELIDEARTTLTVLGVLFGLSIPLQATHRIYAGLQEGYFALTIAGLASLLSVALIVVGPLLHWGITGFLLASYGIQLSSGLVLLLILRRRFGLTLRRLAEYRSEELRALTGSGGLFLLLQIGILVGWEMDPVVLSAFVGPAAVAVYAVVQRMFLLVSGPLSMLNAPLWASYADAHARGDSHYLRATLRRALVATFCLATGGASVVVALHAPLAHFLSKDVLQVPAAFVLIFGAWTIFSAVSDALAMYMNGVQILFPQVVACVAFVVLAIILKLALVQSYGLEGVILGTLVSYLMTTVLLYLTVFRRAICAPLKQGAAAVLARAPRSG